MRSKSIALAVGTGLTALGMGLITPILPWYAQSLGANATLVGLLLAGFGVTRLLVSLPAAWLANRMGHHRLLVGSAAITVPVATLCAVTGSFFALAMFCLVEGALAGVYATVGMAEIVGNEKSKQRGRSLATYQAAGLLGAAVGPALGGLVAQQWGQRAPFLLYAALAAFAAWWLYWRLDQPTLALPSVPDSGAPKENHSSRWPLFAPGLLALWLVTFALAFTRVGAQLAALPLLGAWQLGLNPQQVGLALSLSGFAALATFYPAGWLADRYGGKVTIALGGFGMVGALTMFATSGGYATFVAAALLLGAGSGLAGPAPAAYLADLIPAGDRTTGVGMYRLLGDAGAALAPPLLGWLAEQSGYSMVLSATAVLLLMAVGIFTWLAPADQAVR